MVTIAMLVGLANTLLYSAVGDSPRGGPLAWRLEPWPLSGAYAFSAILAGLLVSAVVVRFMQAGLRGSFFARYGVMVLAVCLGGVSLSVFLSAVTYSFDDHLTAIKRITWFLSTIPFTAVAGGVLGAAEGVILAFPLAAILGRFRTAD